ncbi:PREDICTED: EF-hand calcium-binding domain-containing protein 8 isoform X2 [Chinchilla lanigera]|uniref:EF-hand calcium-binding domain-containing protein 8 isoform X2 n=1 Tax=Chinchilla lanigera TaxID=34839 RepID=UPI000698BCE3|nr:PREDICTED: EF-hand calcium-binding domain-containing protein 8 isoform X2 [Chinchilla lanigera]
MSQLRWDFKTDGLSANVPSWGDQSGSGSRRMSPEDFGESPQPEKLSIPGELQDKEAPRSPPPIILNHHIPDTSPSTQLFTGLHLAEMEKMFEEGIGSTRAMDLETFIRTMKKVLNDVSEEVLESVFFKVDSDGNGFITWPKYVDYMMSEFHGLEEMRRSQYRLRFYLPMRIIPLRHGCEIVKVEFLVQRFKKIKCFLTVTKDGVLQFWSESFLLISSFKLSQIQQPHNQPMWVIDLVCLHNMNLIAVSSTELKIEFFDISNYKCVRAFTLTELDSCILVMDYWSDYHKGVFCLGDTKGNIIIFTSDNVANGLFNPRILPRTSKWDNWVSVSMQKLLNEKSILYRSYWLPALHPNWCQKVKFVPQMNMVVSCSAVEKSSMVMTMLPAKDLEKPKFSILNLRKGILCFDYCPDKNFLVTGGYDSHIRLWNPFISKRPVWLMKGHQTSVTQIIVDSKNSNILISISRDKNIRVWDLQDYVCLQTFSGKHFALGNYPITSAYFHTNGSTLICSTYSIGILKGYLEAHGPMKSGKTTTHNSALCAVLYSKIFKQVVSGCQQGTVSVWEITTGRKMMEFCVSGARLVELTAMALDAYERCLLTGLLDGTMKMWNYNTGECLLTFPNPDQVEISGIVHMNKMYYVTGWSKRITSFMFHKTKPVLLCHHWQTFHTEDVLCMAKYQNQFLATSSYNGDILFWNINMMKPILNFNASMSPLPLQPVKVRETEECVASSHGPRKTCIERRWAHKTTMKLPGSCWRAVEKASLRRTLMSAPVLMRHSGSKEPERPLSYQVSFSTGRSKSSDKLLNTWSLHRESELRKKEPQKKMVLQSNASVEKTRPRLPHTAAMLSSCIDGYIYAWSIHGNGGLLGKFPVDLEDNGDVVGAMTTDENDWILITGDCKGRIKIWDIKDYCIFVGHRPPQSSGMKISTETENKFRFLIPNQLQANIPYYIPLKEKEVVNGQTISLVPPTLLITWKGHLESVADILYVDSLQLIISAGQDRDVKAWKLSGDAIGTFGLSVWKRVQNAMMDGQEQSASPEEKADFTGTMLRDSRLELQRDLAEALAYQQQEQVALMALLNGKEEVEAAAWSRLQRMAETSPWAREHSLEDIEESWSQWESKGKQVSKVVGAAYKPKGRLRSPRVLSANVNYSWMKQQISPQVYQCLYFNDLTPIQKPDFLTHHAPHQQGQNAHQVAPDIQKNLESVRKQTFADTPANVLAAFPSRSPSLSPVASTSRLPGFNSPTSLRPRSSVSCCSPGEFP